MAASKWFTLPFGAVQLLKGKKGLGIFPVPAIGLVQGVWVLESPPPKCAFQLAYSSVGDSA